MMGSPGGMGRAGDVVASSRVIRPDNGAGHFRGNAWLRSLAGGYTRARRQPLAEAENRARVGGPMATLLLNWILPAALGLAALVFLFRKDLRLWWREEARRARWIREDRRKREAASDRERRRQERLADDQRRLEAREQRERQRLARIQDKPRKRKQRDPDAPS